MELHRIIHQQSLCGKTLKFEHVMRIMVLVVNFDLMNFIIARGNHFGQKLMLNMGASYTIQMSSG
jgi:hypothetical protein